MWGRSPAVGSRRTLRFKGSRYRVRGHVGAKQRDHGYGAEDQEQGSENGDFAVAKWFHE